VKRGGRGGNRGPNARRRTNLSFARSNELISLTTGGGGDGGGEGGFLILGGEFVASWPQADK
jgi:hypothetical protein